MTPLLASTKIAACGLSPLWAQSPHWAPSTLWAQLTGSSFLFPEQKSTVAAEVDWVFYFILTLSLIFFVIIIALMVLFMIAYRRQPGVEPADSPAHSTALEVTWSVVPGVLLIFIFYWGFAGYLDLRTPPSDSYDISVMARQWSWEFTYPNGFSDKDLHVPAGRPVRLVMTSNDVLHSLYVPAFRVKQDVVPGRYTYMWFNAEPGEYQLFCTEYCGTDHSDMLAKVIVHPADEFPAWLEKASNVAETLPPVEAGRYYYERKGCAQCHTIDGTPRVGPSFKGVYGRQEKLADGSTVTVDENYIRESILDPQAKVVAGFKPVMSSYKGMLKDKQISVIIEFLKSLK
ncbi:MAG: cytochrome c oxidase subunit II [Pirellulales bacterium]|nr:cytochrome c oxidase subunit II [Pirellulales bacterium]